MNRMKGYKEIGPNGQKVFERVHKEHMSALGAKEKQHYERSQVKKVEANNVEGCIEVTFQNGEWFKYFPNGTWG